MSSGGPSRIEQRNGVADRIERLLARTPGRGQKITTIAGRQVRGPLTADEVISDIVAGMMRARRAVALRRRGSRSAIWLVGLAPGADPARLAHDGEEVIDDPARLAEVVAGQRPEGKGTPWRIDERILACVARGGGRPVARTAIKRALPDLSALELSAGLKRLLDAGKITGETVPGTTKPTRLYRRVEQSAKRG
jgi:hypothetical protein